MAKAREKPGQLHRSTLFGVGITGQSIAQVEAALNAGETFRSLIRSATGVDQISYIVDPIKIHQ